MVRRFTDRYLVSKETARECLYDAGIIDENGAINENYL